MEHYRQHYNTQDDLPNQWAGQTFEQCTFQKLNLAQALNSLGTTIAPWLGGLLILTAAVDTSHMTPDQLQAHRVLEASSVKLPYVGIAIFLGLLAFAISKFRFPTITAIEDESHHTHTGGDSVWRRAWNSARLRSASLTGPSGPWQPRS